MNYFENMELNLKNQFDILRQKEAAELDPPIKMGTKMGTGVVPSNNNVDKYGFPLAAQYGDNFQTDLGTKMGTGVVPFEMGTGVVPSNNNVAQYGDDSPMPSIYPPLPENNAQATPFGFSGKIGQPKIYYDEHGKEIKDFQLPYINNEPRKWSDNYDSGGSRSRRKFRRSHKRRSCKKNKSSRKLRSSRRRKSRVFRK